MRLVVIIAILTACGGSPVGVPDAGLPDARPIDAHVDAMVDASYCSLPSEHGIWTLYATLTSGNCSAVVYETIDFDIFTDQQPACTIPVFSFSADGCHMDDSYVCSSDYGDVLGIFSFTQTSATTINATAIVNFANGGYPFTCTYDVKMERVSD